MLKSELLAALKTEIHRHDFSHFIDEPPSIAQGGGGVVVPGCPTCKKDLSGHATNQEFTLTPRELPE